MLNKFHYGNCKADYAELKHEHEKLKTQHKATEHILETEKCLVRQLQNEVHELKAIHHYERAKLEKELRDVQSDFDKFHARYAKTKELEDELKNLKEAYKICLGDKRECKAELLQLKHDMKYDQSIKIQIKEPEIDANTGEYIKANGAQKQNKQPRRKKRATKA